MSETNEDFAATVRRLFCGKAWSRLMGEPPLLWSNDSAGKALIQWTASERILTVSALPEPGAFRLYAWGGVESVELPEVDEESILTNAGTLIEVLWPACRAEVA